MHLDTLMSIMFVLLLLCQIAQGYLTERLIKRQQALEDVQETIIAFLQKLDI